MLGTACVYNPAAKLLNDSLDTDPIHYWHYFPYTQVVNSSVHHFNIQNGFHTFNSVLNLKSYMQNLW